MVKKSFMAFMSCGIFRFLWCCGTCWIDTCFALFSKKAVDCCFPFVVIVVVVFSIRIPFHFFFFLPE